MEDAAFETGPTDHGGHGPPEWAIEAAKGELSDDASAEEIRRRAVEMVKEEKVPRWAPALQARRRTMDAMSLLKEDHEMVKKILAELESTTERGVKTREELFTKVKQELVVHEAIEEEIFYPALKQHPKTKEIALEGYEEHHVVDTVMAEIEGVAYDDEKWGAKFKVMKENLEHHIEEEEGEMFKQAKQVFDEDELAQLGKSMLARKEELIRQQASAA
jgi:Hemerythrin HHE cation binding domain